jgi:hypothetical protein
MKFLNIFRQSDDPVKHCEVYRKEGCSHVDGYLCHMETCDILEKFLQEKNFEILQEAPENKKWEKRV